MEPALVARVRRWAEEQPDAVAATDRSADVVTYGELRRRASALAAWLTSRGLSRWTSGDTRDEVVVAFYLPHGPLLVAGVVGAWEAGCAFVFVDTAQPRHRTDILLRAASVSCAVVDDGVDAPDVRHVCRSSDWLLRRTAAPPLQPAKPPPSALAYVCFTSGSTGVPKGVAVTHRGFESLVKGQSEAWGVKRGTRTQWAVYKCFDASLSDIGVALYTGATLVCTPPELLTRLGIRAVIGPHRIECADIPPALLAATDPSTAPRCLRSAVIGGEVCPAPAVRSWSAAGVNIWIVYGPTECTVCSSMILAGTSWSVASIGHPIGGTEFKVVGEDAPERGELWIGGVGVARGYLGMPAMTASRFGPCPGLLDGSRWYKTGDAVRLDRDSGTLVFLGRVDRQVKVAGALVAPEEVEEALSSFPGVQRACCVQKPGSGQLFGYVSPRLASEDEIKEHLRTRVAKYMIPQRVVQLPDLPLTKAGKVDSAALAALPVDRQDHAPALEGTVAVLRAIWEAVLGLSVDGAADDFFLLGGTSVSALRVAAMAQSAGLALGPEQVMSHRILRDLAAAADASVAASARVGSHQLRAAASDALRKLWSPPPEAVQRVCTRRRYLLSGVTGFLGSRVLRELLKGGSEVVCVTRAGSAAEAEARVAEAASRWGLSALDAEAVGRVSHVPGDVTAPLWGLPRELVSEGFLGVVHMAGAPHLLADYASLAPCNVHSVLEAARICRLSGARLHFSSSLSVFVSGSDCPAVCSESDPCPEHGVVHGGYAQTKWVAEQVLLRSGVAHSCYRLGLLTPPVGEGRGSGADDQLARFVRGAASVRCLPRSDSLRFDLTPVDWAASSVAALVEVGGEGSAVYHLAGRSSLTLSEAAEVLDAHPRGGGCESVSADVFADRCAEASHRLTTDESAAVLSLCRLSCSPTAPRGFDLLLATGVSFAAERAEAALTARGRPPRPPPPVESFVAACDAALRGA